MDVTRDDDRPELEPPILQGLGQAVPQVDPPSALRARVLSSVARAPTARPARSFLWPLAAVASLVLAAGLGLYTSQLRTRIGGLEDELRDARTRADSAEQRANTAEQRAVDALQIASGARLSLAVLTAPDVARIDLAGQAPVAPRAAARAYWSRSRGMVFTASDLPPLPAGRVYQLWVVTAQPAPLSAGLLTPDAQGGVNVTFNTPADIPQPVALAVTIEPAGGMPGPTGAKYLIGTVAARPA
jgi:Anti-sigma-K factor rskA, C-terminal/Alanine-zipper, major outer membrane lipoprotein